MQRTRLQRTLSLLLAVVMAFGLFTTGSMAAANGGVVFTDHTPNTLPTPISYDQYISELSEQQQEAFDYLTNRPSGAISFEGKYSLEGKGNEIVSVIVEFANPPAGLATKLASAQGKRLDSMTAKTAAAADQMDFLRGVSEMDMPFEITAVYTNAFNGTALDLPASRVLDLLEMDCVYAVYPSIDNYALDVEEDPYPVDLVGMDQGRASLNVNELHDRGIKGNGVVVGIIDTGVDYNHPDLQAAYAGGRNYQNPTVLPERSPDDPMETTYDEWLISGQPEEHATGSKYYTYHGTHVAGTIVGRGTNTDGIRALGIAPEAKFRMYRVLGPYGIGNSTVTAQAIDDVAADGCTVVNMSLGADANDPFYITTVAVNNVIFEHDIVFAISSGNSGDGIGTLGAPGTSPLAIVVGNATNPYTNGVMLIGAGDETYELNLLNTSWEGKIIANDNGYVLSAPNINIYEGNRHKMVATKLDENGMPSGTGLIGEYTDEVKEAVQGNFIIVQRGNLHTDTSANAKAAGAGAVIVIDYESNAGAERDFLINGGDKYLPTYILPYAQGMALYAALKDDDGYFTITGAQNQPQQLHFTSSRGPVSVTYDIKPDICAHGTGVLSSVPYYINNPNKEGDNIYARAYQLATGTSMSSPHIAGVAALLRGYSNDNNLGWSALEIKSRLVNTAERFDKDYSVYEVGGGYANALKALEADFYASVPYDKTLLPSGENAVADVASLSFGYTVIFRDFTKTMQLSLHNKTESAKTMQLSHIFNTSAHTQIMGSDPDATLTYPEQVTIPTGGTTTIDVTIFVPGNPETSGNFEGYLYISEGDASYKVPFAVVAATMPPPAARLSNPMLSRPSISLENQGQLTSTGTSDRYNKSHNSDLYYTWGGSSFLEYSSIYYNARDIHTNQELGNLSGGIFLTFGKSAGDYNQAGAITTKYNPLKTDGSGFGDYDRTVTLELEPGPYTLELSVNGLGGTSVTTMPFYVDGAAPELTLDNAVDGVIFYDEAGVAHITGNVYDIGMAEMNEYDIYYPLLGNAFASQNMNGLIVKIGEDFQKINLDENGDFSFTVSGLNEHESIEMYVLDSFTPEEPHSSVPYSTDFDPSSPSYFDGTYVYYGTNMDVHEFQLALQENQPAINVTVSEKSHTLVAGLAAYIVVSAEQVFMNDEPMTAYLKVGSELLYPTPIVNGSARMFIPAAPEAGVYDIVVKADGTNVEGSYPLVSVAYNTNIWQMHVAPGVDEKLLLIFNAEVTVGSVLMDNQKVSIEQVDPVAIKVLNDVPTGTHVFTANKVKLVKLFPSYTFTYKATYEMP